MMTVFPNFVQKWKFQNAHGKVLLVVYDQAIGIKYWKHCENILPSSVEKSSNIYLFIYYLDQLKHLSSKHQDFSDIYL